MPRLCGEVVGVEWDDAGEAVEIALETEDDRYLIAHNSRQEELLRYVGREVEVEGTIGEGDQGEQAIRVQSFEVLELMAEDDFDEGPDADEVLEEDW